MLKKKDLARRVAKQLGDSIKNVEGILDTAYEEIIKLLQEGEELYINDFGKFSTKQTREMERTTPVGTVVNVPSKTRPIFKFFDSVRDTF